MAHLSKDKGLVSAFSAGKDIHSATAAEVFGCFLEEVVSQLSGAALKAINFWLIYGSDLLFGLSKQLILGAMMRSNILDYILSVIPGVLTLHGINQEKRKATGVIQHCIWSQTLLTRY